MTPKFFQKLVLILSSLPLTLNTNSLAQANENRGSLLLIRAPLTAPREYDSYRSVNPEYQSPNQWYLKNHPQIANMSALIEKFELAQGAYFSKPLSEAQQAYQQVIDLRFKDDWKDIHRQSFMISFLRSAQMESNPKRRGAYLKLALQFDPGHSPDRELFPPPLIEEFNELKAGALNPALRLPEITKNYDWLLINGRPFNLKDRFNIHWPQGRVRISLLSNSYEPQVFVGEVADFSQWQPKINPLAQGDCREPQISGFLPAGAKVLFPGSCLGQRASPPLGNLFPATPPLPSASSTAAPTAGSSPLWNNKWLWLAGSGLLAMVLVNKKNQEKKTAAPSDTYEDF